MSDAPAPHAPTLDYLCDDPDCCPNGCPRVTCRACGQEWPCADWRSRHTATQALAQHRYVARKWYGDDLDMVQYAARDRARLAAGKETHDE